MANEARKEKEAAGRAKLRAGYQELENRKANVRMDVNLREPVKKGRFGASGTSSSRALARGRSRADDDSAVSTIWYQQKPTPAVLRLAFSPRRAT